MAVKFGWCAGVEHAGLLKDLGFDYIECAVTSLDLEDDKAAAEAVARHADSPLPILAWNILFPGGIKVVGPEVDRPRVQRYVDRVVGTLDALGARRVVFGSGGPRRIPDGWDRAQAEEQLVDLLGIMADSACGTGLVFAIEPLNLKECNIINSLAEAVRFAKVVDRPQVRILADFYHMDEDGEPLTAISECGDWLSHIHVADTGREAPGTGGYPYGEFVERLQGVGYDGTVSCECRSGDLAADASSALAFLLNKWNARGAS